MLQASNLEPKLKKKFTHHSCKNVTHKSETARQSSRLKGQYPLPGAYRVRETRGVVKRAAAHGTAAARPDLAVTNNTPPPQKPPSGKQGACLRVLRFLGVGGKDTSLLGPLYLQH